MKLKIPARVDAGNPKNWPRQIARKYPRTLDATSKLLGNVNEMNLRFAVTEFTFERESIARAACAALCQEADREWLGQAVRSAWVLWAGEQPSPKESWLLPWEELGEADKEADRRIGEAIAQALASKIEVLGKDE